jgi:hypothetical protein
MRNYGAHSGEGITCYLEVVTSSPVSLRTKMQRRTHAPAGGYRACSNAFGDPGILIPMAPDVPPKLEVFAIEAMGSSLEGRAFAVEAFDLCG